jgi:hypothetical protein
MLFQMNRLLLYVFISRVYTQMLSNSPALTRGPPKNHLVRRTSCSTYIGAVKREADLLK